MPARPPITADIDSYDTRPFTERYFTTYTPSPSEGKPRNSDEPEAKKTKFETTMNLKKEMVQIQKHTNNLFLVRLNPDHGIFKENEIVEASYQVTEKLNRADNKLSGKKKRNAQWIDSESSIIILKTKKSASDTEFEEIKIPACVRGKLFGINKCLTEGNVKQKLMSPSGFLALVMPNKRELEVVMSRLVQLE